MNTETKKKAWYKNPDRIISMSALAISVVIAIFTYRQTAKETIKQENNAKFQEIKDKLKDIENFNNPNDSTGFANISMMDNIDNVIKEYWQYLKKDTDKNLDGITAYEYLYLGVKCESIFNKTKEAIDYFNYALRKAKNMYDSTDIYRAFCHFYLKIAPYKDTTLAKKYLSLQVAIFKRHFGPVSQYYIAKNFADMASDMNSLNKGLARKWIESAKTYWGQYKGESSEDLKIHINNSITQINKNNNSTDSINSIQYINTIL